MSAPIGKTAAERKASWDAMLVDLANRYGGRPNFDPNADSDPDDSDFVPSSEGEDEAEFTEDEESETCSEEEAEEAEEEEEDEAPAAKRKKD